MRAREKGEVRNRVYKSENGWLVMKSRGKGSLGVEERR
jgi:hypothetical protein